MSDFRSRVLAFYAKHNPENIASVDAIVAKYANREAELFKKLAKKYGDPLDFRSCHFDPLEALRQGAIPPVPDAPRLDNISKCRDLLPTACDAFDARVKHEPHHAPAPPPSSRAADLLKTITDPMREGPFSLLWRALHERARVTVVIRRINSVRGNCVGLLKAFDRHMNLVLVDVDETYAPLYGRQISRSMRQVLVRGDTIVLVARAR